MSRIKELFENRILKQINDSNGIPISNLKFKYNLDDQDIILKLFEGEFLYETCINNIEMIQVTQRGKVRLFMNLHKKFIKTFINKLNNLQYDSSILFEYLMHQDMDNSKINDLLSIEQYNNFYKSFHNSIRLLPLKNKGK